MASVTQRIKEINQPRYGFVNPKDFKVTVLNDDSILNEKENIRANLIGLAVDYLTRFMLGAPKQKAFKVSLKGAEIIEEDLFAEELLKEVNGIDERSIINVCKLVGFDVVYRVGPLRYKPVELINPDRETIENIEILVKRSLLFFEKYGPITKDGFTFEGGYTKLINIGDGDFLTEDTLWDFKVLKKGPTSQHTLQLLVYYLMGIHSRQVCFQSIKSLGIFNPRLNKVYILFIDSISKDIIERVESEVIGY